MNSVRPGAGGVLPPIHLSIADVFTFGSMDGWTTALKQFEGEKEWCDCGNHILLSIASAAERLWGHGSFVRFFWVNHWRGGQDAGEVTITIVIGAPSGPHFTSCAVCSINHK